MRASGGLFPTPLMKVLGTAWSLSSPSPLAHRRCRSHLSRPHAVQYGKHMDSDELQAAPVEPIFP